MKYEYRLMKPEDLSEIVNLDLRKADRIEIEAGVGLLPSCALYKAVLDSEKVWVITLDDRIEGVFGVAPCDGGTGSPWLLGTEAMIQVPKKFLRASKKIVEEMKGMYSVLFNWVSEDNTAALRWLEFLGFTLHEHLAVPMDSGVVFIPFTIIKE